MTSETVTLRRESIKERTTIRSLNEAAFGRSDEADLVDRLRTEGALLASFVADMNEQIVGHILFSRLVLRKYHIGTVGRTWHGFHL
jgi:putative acetyltransferase